MPEVDRLQRPTRPRLPRGLANDETVSLWFAVGRAMGAYEHAPRHAVERRGQSGKPIGGSTCTGPAGVRMLGNVTARQAMMPRLAELQDEGLMEDEHASLAEATRRSSAVRRSATRVSSGEQRQSCSKPYRPSRRDAEAIDFR